MIVKHIPMNSIKKSSFAGLVTYITHAQGKQERVGLISVTNCQQPDAFDAVMEVEAIQAQNTRTLSDKNYHMLISFRAGEKPDEKILKIIESRVCASLGYGEHQRVSAIHHDTDNLHIHVAINKIHPNRLTIHEPYYDYKTLAQICEKLEIEYGLERDNHIPRKRGAENRAEDMERNAGIESLLGFIKRECLLRMKEASTWAELHQLLGESGLEMRQQGNGLILSDKTSGVTVKASSIDRELSKKKLEAKLGEFEKTPSAIDSSHQKTSVNNNQYYEKKPVRMKINTSEIYARYREDQQNIRAVCSAELASLRSHKNRFIEKAKNMGRLKRAAIKLMQGHGMDKKILYALVSKTLKKELEKSNKQYLKERQKIYDKYKKSEWVDWLKKKATEGDTEALRTLRAREGQIILKGNALGGKDAGNTHSIFNLKPDSITGKGTVIYSVGAASIRDDGKLLEISNDARQGHLELLLRMAIQRYGQCLTINGSEQFKMRIINVAAAKKLNVTFDDTASEQRRHFLMKLFTQKEQNYEQRQNERTGKDRRGENRGSPESIKPIARGEIISGKWGKRISRQQFHGQLPKPYFARIGKRPPPVSKNRLRSLSQLDVVQLASGSEMLLSGDVSRHMEHQGAQADHVMRRGISGAVAVKKTEGSKKNIKRKSKKNI
jgi:hypothetical protein